MGSRVKKMDILNFKKRAAGLAALGAAALLLSSGAWAAGESLVPVGEAVGIAVRTDGVMVSELSEFETGSGKVSPARDAGLLPGDVITAIDNREFDSAAGMSELLANSGETVTVTYTRGDETRSASLKPYRDGDGAYLGVWVRDSLTGIGTVTYYDPASGEYGALGHSISDSATGTLVPVGEGEILDAEVTGVTKSRAGSPGQLGGSFDFSHVLGTINENCGVGIFGKAAGELCGFEPVPVAPSSEVRPGKAQILSDASGQRRTYNVEITRVYRGNEDGRDMMLKVTDPDLLALTGGIVQGMSGSPILQDGKLIGAVTHVLINDPQKGYGVFLENMLSNR